jgi:predicted transcriptional regulator
MSSDSLRPLEVETLRIVRKGGGKYTWYQVSRILPVCDFPGEEQNASKILRRLELLGFLKSSVKEKEHPRYDLTESGRNFLDQLGIEPARCG